MKIRHTLAALLGAAFVVGAMAAPAAAAPVAASSCRLAYTASHNADSVSATFSQTCGISWRAWGDWQNAGYHYGTYRKMPGGTPYSVACAVPSTCGSGGGSFWSGGIQRKDTGAMRCLWGCGSHAALTADYDCDWGTISTSIHFQPGGLGAVWTADSDPDPGPGGLDGCTGMWTTVQDSSGAQTHSGVVGGDHIWTWTYAKNGGSMSVGWVNWSNPDSNPGGCSAQKLYPSRGAIFNINARRGHPRCPR